MTRPEFATVMGYLQAGCGMREPPTPAQAEVYFDLLGDLPAEAAMTAARMVLIDHVYPNLPPAGAIRKAAVGLGNIRTDPAEAWAMFLAAVRSYGTGTRRVYSAFRDPTTHDCQASGLASLPPDVQRAARAFGWQTLADTSPQYLGAAQERFLRIFQSTADASERQAVLPPSVRDTIAAIGSGIGRGVAAIEEN